MDKIQKLNQMKENKKSNFSLKTRVLKVQDSFISQKLISKDMKFVFNLILTSVIFIIIVNIIYYILNPKIFINEVKFVIHKFEKIELFIIQEIVYLIALFFVIYPLTKLWINKRRPIDSSTEFSSAKAYLDISFTLIMIVIIGSFHIASLYTIFKYDVHLVMTIAMLSEKIRLTMKTYAFILENKRKQEAAYEKDNKNVKFTTYRQLLYYLGAPTFIYCDEYPRLEKRNYKFLLKLCLQFVVCLYIIMIIFLRIILPPFEEIGTRPIEFRIFFIDLVKVFAAASFLCLLVFYTFLHLYTNICSQIFLFGDRCWYEDWWSCTNYSTYYRKWNLLVHDWIHSYLYIPLVYIFDGKKLRAAIISIFISAVAHEYIIASSLRQVNPILTILFCSFGVILFAYESLTNKKNLKKSKEQIKEATSYHHKKEIDYGSVNYTIKNVLFLLGLFNGWFLMITIYTTGYFAKKNCMENNSSWIINLPEFYQCLNKTFNHF